MTRTPPRGLNPTVDYGPLAVFLLVYIKAGLLAATGTLIAATAVSVAVALWAERRGPWMPLTTAVVVGIFGGLTLWSGDDIFIKLSKP